MMLDATVEFYRLRREEEEKTLRHFEEADAARAKINEEDLRRALKLEEQKEEAIRKRIEAQRQLEQDAATRLAEAMQAQAQELASFLQNTMMQAVDLFGQAFSSIGRLQNETVTEIVRNEEGMLEERTRITKQYVQDVGGALKSFLGDTAEMFGKAALHYVAVESVKAMATAIASSFSTLGIFALIGGAAIGAAAYGMTKLASNRIPAAPKFHVGGIVPGVPGRERMALVQSGERIVSAADTADGRGGGGGITINNNLLVAPSRVQVERVNRDVLMPSMRRLQRLGFAG